MSKNYIAAVLVGVSVFAVSSASSVSRDVASEQSVSYDGQSQLQFADGGTGTGPGGGSGRPQVQFADGGTGTGPGGGSGRPQFA